MKILYLCHRIPYPPHKGDKIRSYYQVKHLAKQHEVHLYCLADQREDLQYADELRKHCPVVEIDYLNPTLGRLKSLLSLPFPGPITLPYFHSSRLMGKVKEAIKQQRFDLGVAYSSGMIPYLWDAGLPWVIDFVDLDSQKWLQYAAASPPPLSWIYRLEGNRLFQYERAASERAGASILVTEEEGRLLAERGSPRRLCAVSLGVDLDFYRLDQPKEESIARMERPVLIFVGVMDYRPNYEGVLRFARSILPRIAEQIPEVLFLVVGAHPTPAVKALHDGEKIIVTGKVPDTRPYLKAATLAPVPLFIARGIQTKVLEAMAMELPVVLTPRAALGVGAVADRDYQVAGDDEEMAQAVVHLLRAPEEARALGKRGRKFVEENFTWQNKLEQYEEILKEVVADSPVSTAGAR